MLPLLLLFLLLPDEDEDEAVLKSEYKCNYLNPFKRCKGDGTKRTDSIHSSNSNSR